MNESRTTKATLDLSPFMIYSATQGNTVEFQENEENDQPQRVLSLTAHHKWVYSSRVRDTGTRLF